jgi:cytochrome c553
MRRLLAAPLALALALSACGKNNEPPPPSSGSPNAQPESAPNRPRGPGAEPTATARGQAPAAGNPGGPAVQAQQLFSTLCVMCHGADGTGNGPAAASLNPKPRNYTDAAWQASITDEQIKETILKGGQAVGKSPMMPGQPQLADQPEVLDGLVKIIRGFGKHP